MINKKMLEFDSRCSFTLFTLISFPLLFFLSLRFVRNVAENIPCPFAWMPTLAHEWNIDISFAIYITQSLNRIQKKKYRPNGIFVLQSVKSWKLNANEWHWKHVSVGLGRAAHLRELRSYRKTVSFQFTTRWVSPTQGICLVNFESLKIVIQSQKMIETFI